MCDDDRREDNTEDLAATLGMTPEAFAEVFGARWRKVDGPVMHDFDLDPDGDWPGEATTWMIAGEPPLLMLWVFGHGVFIARPVGRWDRNELVYDPTDRVYVPSFRVGDDAPDIIQRLITARRRTLRWCRYCRTPFGPERMLGDVCMGCGTAWLGIVY
jgi:hypothetical protein